MVGVVAYGQALSYRTSRSSMLKNCSRDHGFSNRGIAISKSIDRESETVSQRIVCATARNGGRRTQSVTKARARYIPATTLSYLNMAIGRTTPGVVPLRSGRR